ncbi:MAG: S8 family serine peptidase [Lachnospiraceae bacterium]|nr:S8 family serine peptidase [Lachnospiraceae bacterium]
MFCPKCGSEINKNTRLCQICGYELSSDVSKSNLKNNTIPINNSDSSNKRTIIIFAIAIVVLVLLTLAIFIIIRSYRKDSLLPQRSNAKTETSFVNMTDSNNNDYGKIYYAPIDENHIAEQDYIRFIDNEILIVVKDGVSEEQVIDLSKRYACNIVGEIEISGDYQLRFSDVLTKEELDSIIERLLNEEIINSASINYVSEVTITEETEKINDFYYGEKWQKSLQNYNDCIGKSWGIEAINTFEAWDELFKNRKQVNPVKIGLIDTGFDVEHEDLGFAEVFYDNNINGVISKQPDHGTHVAGTMAATCNDKTGICGVYPYGDGLLYGVCYAAGEGLIKYNTAIMSEKIAFAELIVRNVKVINSSRGFDYSNYDGFDEWYNKTKTDSHFKYDDVNADLCGDFLQRMLNKGYDFVIVSSAGNNSRDLPEKFDCKHSYYLNNISKDKFPDVYNRIIVVGAVNNALSIAPYSDGGDRVDIYAPGGDYSDVQDIADWFMSFNSSFLNAILSPNLAIYSTTPNNSYGVKHGTSMAAPHVSGVAAMVWSANNSLSGADVKRIITSYQNPLCTSCKLLDAQQAVSHALNTKNGGNSSDQMNGSVLCYVVERNNEENKISNAYISMKNINTEKVYTTTTDFEGHFEILLPEGEYTLSVSADGFEEYVWPDNIEHLIPITVKNEQINYLDDWIKMDKTTNQEEISKPGSETKDKNDTIKEKGDTPPVLLKETYYYSDGSDKKICTELSTTIYKYNKDGLFIRSNQYFPAGVNPESLERIENDDWSQKYVEYDNSGNLVAKYRDNGDKIRCDTFYIYDNEGRLIKEYYNLDETATLSNIIANNVNIFYYDEKGNNIKEEHCNIKKDGSESCYQYVEYEYDEKGNMISRTVQGDGWPSTTLYTYDENNRLICEKSAKDGSILEEYDGYGHRTYFRKENYYCAHQFDEEGRLIKCTYTTPSEGHFTFITDEYNEWGQVIKSTSSEFYKWKVNSIADIKKPENNEVRTYIYGYPEDFDLSDLVSEDNYKVEASDMILDEAEYNRQLETLSE